MTKIQMIMKHINSVPGHASILRNLKIISAGNGCCVAEYKVDKKSSNSIDCMHGGFSATLVDAVSSYALLSDEEMIRPTMSVDLHLTYIKPAQLGEEIVIDAKTMKAGQKLAFLTVDITNKKTGDLLVKGLHTKYMK